MELTEQKEKPIEKLETTEAPKDLTFMDGVLVTWEIFDRILEKQLDGEKDSHGYYYLDIILDDVTLYLQDFLLLNGYCAERRKNLFDLFIPNNLKE